jgi:hypothetical protein
MNIDHGLCLPDAPFHDVRCLDILALVKELRVAL